MPKINPCLTIPSPLTIEEVLPEGIITWRRFIGPKLPLYDSSPKLKGGR
jgi:hypothetical protein